MNEAADGQRELRLLLTVEEAAMRLGLSRSHCYRLIQTGALRSISIGRSRRIPVFVLSEFVSARLQAEFSDF